MASEDFPAPSEGFVLTHCIGQPLTQHALIYDDPVSQQRVTLRAAEVGASQVELSANLGAEQDDFVCGESPVKVNAAVGLQRVCSKARQVTA